VEVSTLLVCLFQENHEAAQGLQVQDAPDEMSGGWSVPYGRNPQVCLQLGSLERRKSYYAEYGKGISQKQLSSELTALKSQPDTLWLREVDSQMLQQALRDVVRAFEEFFRERNRFPRYRSKKAGHFAFRIPQRVKVDGGKVYVPKVGWVRIRQSREVAGNTKSATFKRDAGGPRPFPVFSAMILPALLGAPRVPAVPPLAAPLVLEDYARRGTGINLGPSGW
jgi:putative transposase